MSLYNLPPVRCMTCRHPRIGFLSEAFLRHMKSSPTATEAEFFAKHNIALYCCRSMFLAEPYFLGVPGTVERMVDNVAQLKLR